MTKIFPGIYDTTKPNVIETTNGIIQVSTINEALNPMIFLLGVKQPIRQKKVEEEPMSIDMHIESYVMVSALPKDLQEQVRSHIRPTAISSILDGTTITEEQK